MFLSIVSSGLVSVVCFSISFFTKNVLYYGYLNFHLLKNLRNELKIIFVFIILFAAGIEIILLFFLLLEQTLFLLKTKPKQLNRG